MMIFWGHSRAKMGEKSTKIGHLGHFRGMKRAKNGQKWVIFEARSLAKRSNPGQKKSGPQKFKSSQKKLIPAQLGKFLGSQVGQFWPSGGLRGPFRKSKMQKKFRAQGGAAPLEVPPRQRGSAAPSERQASKKWGRVETSSEL